MALLSDNEINIIIKARDDASGKLKAIADQLGFTKKGFEQTATASRQFAGAIAVAATAASAFAFAGVKTAAQLETSRQGFITLLGSVEKADEILKQIKKDAAATPFELPGLIQANQLLTAVTKDGGRSEKILLNVGKALAAAGKGQASLDMVISNLQQIGNTATISEMDVRQFGNQGINILELLADYYGVTKAEASDMVKESKDAFADLEGALAKAGAEGGRFANAFTDQAGTFNQLVSNMKDSFNIFMSDLVTQIGLFDFLKKVLGGFVQFLSENTDVIITKIKEMAKWFGENKWAMAALAGAITAMLIPALVALGIAMIPLLQLAVTWGAVGAIVAGVLAVTGGFQGLLDVIDQKTGFVTVFKWAWDQIVTTFNETLLPALASLWEALKPLEPVLSFLAKVIGGVLVVAVWAIITAITGWIEIFTGLIALGAEVTAAVIRFYTKPIQDLIEAVKTAVGWVSKLLDKMSQIGGKAFKGVKRILGFEHGGLVPGTIGQPVPIIAHGGERVIPASQSNRGGGGSYTININNPIVSDRNDLSAIRSQIEAALRDVVRNNKLLTS